MHLSYLPHQYDTAEPRSDLILRGALWLLLCLLVAHALYVLLRGLGNPLLDIHHFRQTQTALTAYWLLQGGPVFAYETPVVGYPWSIPFEFPVFQGLVAILGSVGVPLDTAGRLVSFAFFLGTLWPMRMLFRTLALGETAFLATAILFCASPLYLFWARTFLVETCAVFFSLLWLALFARYLSERRPFLATAATLAGTLGVLAKPTTFPAFAVLGAFIVAYRLWLLWRDGKSIGTMLGLCTIAGAVTAVPFLVGFVWVYAGDAIKLENEFGRLLTSASLRGWNFGNLQQKIGTALWVETLQKRVLPDLFGWLAPLALAAWGATFARTRSGAAAALAVIAFLTPLLVFTNLHVKHNYYQVANGIFAIAAVGIGIASVAERLRGMLAIVLICAIAAAQLYFFRTHFWPYVIRDYSDNRLLRIAAIAKGGTSHGQSLIVIGDEWASTVPYYSGRRSFVVPTWTPVPLLEKLVADPQRYLGSDPLGGIVYCADQLKSYKERAPLIERFVAGRTVLGEYGGCQLLAPSRQSASSASYFPG